MIWIVFNITEKYIIE